MGVPRFLKDRYNLLFIVLLILFIVLLNFNNHAVLGWDESRHAVQGHIFYDWFRTAMNGEFTSFERLVASYAEKGIPDNTGYGIGWFAYFDPPFHAMAQAVTYLFFGNTVHSARFATHLLILFLAPFLYLLASRILKSKPLGIAATFMYLTAYVTFYYGRWSFLEVPISLCMVAWYYFLFYKDGKRLTVKFSSKLKISLQSNVVISAVFLSAATMMKYQSLIFATVFMAAYIIFLFTKEWRSSNQPIADDFMGIAERSGAWSLGWKYVLQGVVVFILCFWWINLALFQQGMWDRVLYEGAGRERAFDSGFFLDYPRMTLQQTRLIEADGGFQGNTALSYLLTPAWFAGIPVILWFLRKKDSFLAKNPRLFIYISIIYLTATFLISNRQLRYMIHALPFFFIVVVQGIRDFSDFVSKRFSFKHLSLLLIVLILAFSVRLDIGVQQDSIDRYGRYSPELREYMEGLKDPKYLLNIKGKVDPARTGYYHTPDLFIFEAMSVKRIPNPRHSNQYVTWLEWLSIAPQSDQFFGSLYAVSGEIPSYIFAFKYDGEGYAMIDTVRESMKAVGFIERELEWYYVYSRE